jgi:hypothetical protein
MIRAMVRAIFKPAAKKKMSPRFLGLLRREPGIAPNSHDFRRGI